MCIIAWACKAMGVYKLGASIVTSLFSATDIGSSIAYCVGVYQERGSCAAL